MKRLFLCSSFADVANLFVDCAKEDLQGKIIAFIPTASLTEPIRFYVKKGKKALEEANVKLEDIDAITPTYGPGLVGALLVGVSYAKALAFANEIPLVGVNHIQGHIAANYVTYKELKPPFLCVMMSGGNTQIIHVKSYTEFEVLGKTRDDAIRRSI